MRPLCVLCWLLTSVLPLCAEDWTTADGKVYKNVTVAGQENDGVRITYEGGVGKIPYYELPVDIQRRFGQDIDSLAIRKHAVDMAIDDAVRSAAAADQMKLRAEAPPVVPKPVPPPPPAPVTDTGSTPATGAPAGPGPTAGGPAPSPTLAAHAGGTNGPAAAAPEGLPNLAEPVSHTPAPQNVKGALGKQLELSVANYSYNAGLDVCYLDSPAVDFIPEPPPKTPLPPGQGSSLTLRVVTEGSQPQAPDRVEATFLSVGGGGDVGAHPVSFVADDVPVTIEDSAKKDSGTLSGGGQAVQYVSFYLTADQARKICTAKGLTISVGGFEYRPRPGGLDTLQRYLTDVDSLAPASSSFVRSFYKWLGHIPSFFSIISTICEWVILGSFTILVAASIAAFILGVTRFIKM